MAKYIFITGGVVSSLGKGITAASVGAILKSCGLKVTVIKIDPYLNVDPGTMSPFQHGEVFVTDDGAETDLDLGHYERFMDISVTKDCNFTSGSVYDSIITKERKGEFLGGTVQVIPHVTNEIKSRIKKLDSKNDVVIVEIGGTTGDIEGLPFLEAIRQLKQEMGPRNTCSVHVTLIPYIRAAAEMKTKPTQQSVAKLREIGIQPDIIVCRTEKPLNYDLKRKIALFCNVREEAVIEEKDVDYTIYEVPLVLKEQRMDKLIMDILDLKKRSSNLKVWSDLLDRIKNPKGSVNIAIAGKYTELKDSYKSIWEALEHAAIANNVEIDIKYIDVEKRNFKQVLRDIDGILVPGGFGDRGIEEKIEVVHFARENRIPFLGLCLGMQCAVIEFARNVCGLKNANSTEFNSKTPYPVIDLMLEQKKVTKMGGTMRLGKYPCKLKKNSLAHKAYKKDLIYERHRHRYEFNNKYRKKLEKTGLNITGVYQKGNLVEIIELKNHPWFLAVQFHPEFKSRPNKAHPLFKEFIKASK
ncbi:MAG: CTP synthase [Endomicrobiales bacterium]|nr:CTP synthase [Endomicrobiales bacterium]